MEPKEFYKILGSRIAETRKVKGLTQSALADKARLTRAGLASIETGRQGIHVHQLIELANVLGVKNFESLLPADLWLHENLSGAPKVVTTGSSLTLEQKKQVASIVELLG